MNLAKLPIGSFVRIQKCDLQSLVADLKQVHDRVVGPREIDAAIVYDDLDHVDQLPIGVTDHQDGGVYRLTHQSSDSHFDYVVGPQSLKGFLFPPRETVSESVRTDGKWEIQATETPVMRIAVLGPRACDLRALAIQDKVFLEGPYVDPGYQRRRDALFIVAVNCRRSVATCFCHAMDCGPAVTSHFDLALTEMDDHFAVEIGTPAGGLAIEATSWVPMSEVEVAHAKQVPAALEESMQGGTSARQMETGGIRELLMDNLEHPRWQEVAERCLSCGNCTMVCPTCFCSSVDEVTDLSGDHVRRERSWASCFTAEHSYMHSGNVRKTTRSKYRQWLTHKLATWQDQFDSSGCTGCGRCITWCPVGIDLTEEVAAIRGE
ncbi:MAG: 4Fe-4S dicluster domain-containing protein [Rubripirellula sp.]|nr:4Fe-4S dicluster domain-containing protein [Rubripirellula sp.]